MKATSPSFAAASHLHIESKCPDHDYGNIGSFSFFKNNCDLFPMFNENTSSGVKLLQSEESHYFMCDLEQVFVTCCKSPLSKK